MHYTSAARTHVGRVRRHNEDAFLERPEIGLWAVADGMGGSSSGAHASNMIVQALKDISPASSLAQLVWETKSVLHEVNHQLLSDAADKGDGAMYGSTVVVLLAHGEEIACLWAGDSRLYRLRDGELRQLSRDHSEVQELVASGVLTAEEALRHPTANVVTRAIGAVADIDLEVAYDRSQAGDRYLMCSDGLSKMLRQSEIAVLLAEGPFEMATKTLIERALDRGGLDNVTVAVVEAS
jgi:serine/threonine protein phosphatase PrpC